MKSRWATTGSFHLRIAHHRGAIIDRDRDALWSSVAHHRRSSW
jgi:hypothetical protein